ncbi:hypothetical protein HK101_004903, partial [Irineochytrium annulatum]
MKAAGLSWRTADQVRTHIAAVENQYRRAVDWQEATVGGLMADGQAESVAAYVRKLCQHYDDLDPITRDRASTKPLVTTADALVSGQGRPQKIRRTIFDDDGLDTSSGEERLGEDSQDAVTVLKLPSSASETSRPASTVDRRAGKIVGEMEPRGAKRRKLMQEKGKDLRGDSADLAKSRLQVEKEKLKLEKKRDKRERQRLEVELARAKIELRRERMQEKLDRKLRHYDAVIREAKALKTLEELGYTKEQARQKLESNFDDGGDGSDDYDKDIGDDVGNNNGTDDGDSSGGAGDGEAGRGECDGVRRRIVELEREVDGKEVAVRRMEGELRVVTERGEEVGRLGEEVVALKALVRARDAEVEEREKEVMALKREVEEGTKVIGDLRALAEERERELGDLRAAMQGREAVVDEKETRMEERITDFSIHIANRERQITALTEQLGALQETHSKGMKEGEEKIRKLKGLLGQASKSMQESKRLLMEKDADLEGLRSSVEDLSSGAGESQFLIKEQEQSINELKQRLEDERVLAEDKVAQYEREIKELRAETLSVRTEFQSYKVKAHAALRQSTSSATETRMEELAESNGRLEREKAELESELVSTNHRIRSLESELSSSLEQFASLEAHVKRLESSTREASILKQELEAANRRLEIEKEMNTEAIRTRDLHHANAIDAVRKDLKRTVEALEERVKQKASEAASLSAISEQLGAELSALRTEMAQVK